MGHIYVREKELEDNKDTMNDVLNIINKIQKALEAQISNNTWMDAETKNKAIEKSKLIRFLGKWNLCY